MSLTKERKAHQQALSRSSGVGYSDVEDFSHKITAYDALISGALHALIIAHAFGIRMRRTVIILPDIRIPEDGTRSSDHSATFSSAEAKPLDLSLHSALSDASADLCCEVSTRPRQAP